MVVAGVIQNKLAFLCKCLKCSALVLVHQRFFFHLSIFESLRVHCKFAVVQYEITCKRNGTRVIRERSYVSSGQPSNEGGFCSREGHRLVNNTHRIALRSCAQASAVIQRIRKPGIFSLKVWPGETQGRAGRENCGDFQTERPDV